MDRQLKLLSDSLKDKKTLISGLNVQNFNKKMELRGFIPVAFDANILAICDTSLDLFNFDVVADKIRVLNPLQKNLYGKTATYTLYPIAKKIQVSGNTNTIPVTNNLRLPDYFKDNKLDLTKANASPQFEFKENETIYHPENKDIIFYRNPTDTENPIAIAKEFYCLCVYENSVTGKIDYCIADPWTLVLIP